MKKLYQIFFENMIGQEDQVKRYVKVGGAVIVKEGENREKLALLLQRSANDHWPNVWEYPRGKCNKKENITKCIKREVKEETGLDIEPIKLIDTFEYIADNGERKSTSYNYICKMKDENQKVKLSKEHQDFKWVMSVGEIEMMLHQDQKKTLIKVFYTDEQIVDYPENDFSKNNEIEEYSRIGK